MEPQKYLGCRRMPFTVHYTLFTVLETAHSIQVEGMTCGNCALSIQQLLAKRGAKHVSANASSGEVHFTVSSSTDVPAALDAIDDLGYRVVRESADSESGIAHHGHDHGSGTAWMLPLCALLTVPLLAHMFISAPVLHNAWVQWALATPVFGIGLYAFGGSAFRSLRHGLPNMNVLIVLGATAAYAYSLAALATGDHRYLFFETAASIITLVMAGNWLEARTVKATTASIDALARLQPQRARLVMVDSIGKETVLEVDSRDVHSGDLVRVATGDGIPVDGTIERGDVSVDERMITGESLPAQKAVGDAVVGGTVLLDGTALIRATTVGEKSALANIVRLVRQAQGSKPPLQKLADRISAVFVPAVLGVAALTFLVNFFALHHLFPESMARAIAVLVISCPCAMGLATPAAVAVGLGRAARMGILVKGGDTLERMRGLKQMVFDKTGTLTTGELRVEEAIVDGILEEDFRSRVAALESYSSHPIAKSIVRQWGNGDAAFFRNVREEKGRGMEGTDAAGSRWQLGSQAWAGPAAAPAGYDLYLTQDGAFRGALKLSDELRPDAAGTIAELKRMGFRTILLSGDRQEKCEAVAARLGIDEVLAEKTPEEKNAALERLSTQAPTGMVGDGINDAPALARAAVGFSLGDATQIAIGSASVILSGNKLSALPRAIRLGVYTEATIKSNLFWAFIYNVVAIPVAAAGLLHPTWGAGVMALSDVVLVLNSLRLGVRRLG